MLELSANTPTIAFVVLHYRVVQATLECVSSIRSLDSAGTRLHIVVVDNDRSSSLSSLLNEIPNGDSSELHYIPTNENLGFANGNNVGYSYAKDELGAQFVVCCNNDVIFQQHSFIEALVDLWHREHYCVLGPDVFSPQLLQHQSPTRSSLDTRSSVLRHRRQCSVSLHRAKGNSIVFWVQGLAHGVPRIESIWYRLRRFFKNDVDREWQIEQRGVELHGSCVIFAPEFVSRLPWAFFPETYMYREEAILRYISDRLNMLCLYSPELQVLHFHGLATSVDYRNFRAKKIFFLENCIRSDDAFVHLIDNWDSYDDGLFVNSTIA